MTAALVAGAPAHAAPCWSAHAVSAARVRQMQTMLMVAALRCRAAKLDIIADYDGFVRAQGDAIASANLAIKQHFAAIGGTQADYDRFATSLANGFGDDETSAESCAEAAALAHEGTAAAGPAALERVATGRLFPAALPGGACEAANQGAIAAALPPVVMAQAPAPIAAPVDLPDDVTAALAVLARLRTATPPTPQAATEIAAVAH